MVERFVAVLCILGQAVLSLTSLEAGLFTAAFGGACLGVLAIVVVTILELRRCNR